MHRTTVMLPAGLKAKATRYAQEKGLSLGELIRQSLTNWLNRSDEQEPSDPLLADEAIYHGPAPSDLAAAHDRYLYGDARDLP